MLDKKKKHFPPSAVEDQEEDNLCGLDILMINKKGYST